jgi:hypothetical protein
VLVAIFRVETHVSTHCVVYRARRRCFRGFVLRRFPLYWLAALHMRRPFFTRRTFLSALLAALGAVPSFGVDNDPASGADATSEPLQSGLKVGEKVPTFYVRAVTGPLKNKSVCYVCRNGDRPVVMIFVRQITPELKRLLKGIDDEVDRHRAAGLRSFAVFLAGENDELLPRVQTLAFDEKINLPLTIAAAPSDGSAGRTIHPHAAVTVVLYRDQTVTANFALRAAELNAEAIEAVLKTTRALAADETP